MTVKLKRAEIARGGEEGSGADDPGSGKRDVTRFRRRWWWGGQQNGAGGGVIKRATERKKRRKRRRKR